MQHQFFDACACRDTPLSRIDGRVKVIAALTVIVTAVSLDMSRSVYLSLVFLILAWLTKLAKVPLAYLRSRLVLVLPLAAVVGISILGTAPAAYGSRVQFFGLVMAKAFASVWTLVLLTATTPFPELLESLARLKMPRIFLMLLGFCYRYLFLMTDEIERMKHTLASRGYEGRWILQARFLGHLAGTFFIRSYERSERIFAAMLSRGYEGRERWQAHE